MTRLILFILLTLWPFAARAQFVITEFLASNSNGLKDELGNEEDWIEIQNTGVATTSLAGWYLTDESGNLRKWPLPAWTLAPGNRIVVFASSRNRTPAQTAAGIDNAGTPASPRLATNFKIGAGSGGYLALAQDQAGGGVAAISVFANYAQQVPDVSFGVTPSTVALVATNTPIRALVPAVANGGNLLGASWRGGAEPFNDGAWNAGTTGAGKAAPATMVAGPNLTLRLNANDAANLVTDTSSAGHSGVNTSGTTIHMPSATDTAANPLLRRGALQFDQAVNSQVTVAGHADFNSTTGTIMFWMKAGNVVGNGNEGAMLWDRRQGSGNVLVLMNTTHGGGTNAGRLFSQPAGSSSFYSTQRVDDNQWHHVAFVYNQAANGTDTF